MTRKVLIITGASKGIGAATARLAWQDYDIAINYHQDKDGALQLLSEIEATGGKGITVQGDVSEEQDVLDLFDETEKQLGPIAGLVNNAGILMPNSKLENIGIERLQRIFSVNVVGAFLCAREAVKRMSTANGGQGGSIVNISSVGSILGSPNEFIDYAATKGAIDTLTIGLSKEVANEGIRVNAVRPGLIETAFHDASGVENRIEKLKGGVPMQRTGSAQEVAESIIWLLSEKASYVTGALLNVSGGR